MLRKLTPALLSASLILLAACRADVNIQPTPSTSPTPQPTASPTPTPMPSPTATPGWITATIRPTVATNDAVLAEVRKLETEGKVTGVMVMESFPVQIRLNGSAEVVAQLEAMAAGVRTIQTTSLSQRSSNIQAASTRTVTSAEAFTELWRQHTGSLDAPPSVDFGQQTVLAVFAGEKPTGGYTTVITAVTQLDKTLTVRYKVNTPAANQPVTQVVTYPAHIVAIPLSQAKGDFTQVNFVSEP